MNYWRIWLWLLLWLAILKYMENAMNPVNKDYAVLWISSRINQA